MDQQAVIDLSQKALLVVIYVSAPMLGVSVIVGFAISIFQATTQIQEQTLTFVPKILAVIASIAIFGSWMLRVLIEFTMEIFNNMDSFIR